MKPIETVDDVFPAIDELIAELISGGHSRLADVLHHRMCRVAWTARSELLEELQAVLTEALESDGANLPYRLTNQMEQANRVIGHYLKNSEP